MNQRKGIILFWSAGFFWGGGGGGGGLLLSNIEFITGFLQYNMGKPFSGWVKQL